MIKKNLNIIIIGFILIMLVIAAPLYHFWNRTKSVPAAAYKLTEISSPVDNSYKLIDNQYIYGTNNNKIVDFYITVLKPDEDKNITFDYINNGVLNRDVDVPGMRIIFQEGDQNGPLPGYLGYGEKNANAVLELRGSSTRLSNLKSYKIRFESKKIQWQNMRTINLNKHPYDLTRVRNKLSFDYFRMIPDTISLRTNFVRLHVKDLSGTNPTPAFQDYGLYTQIEQPNKSFLAAHGLNENGVLYKAENFEFFRSPEVLKNVDDAGFNKEVFEQVLSIRVGNDNKKLLRMLDGVNDYSQNINQVVDKYFDRDNYLTWMAINILMGNWDTNSQNFMLYSPPNTDKFYFLPWDYDAAWGFPTQTGKTKQYYASWQRGLSNYWGVVLHHRFFQDPENVKALSLKVDEVSLIIKTDNTKKLLDSYYGIVAPELAKSPDNKGLPGTFDEFKIEYARLPGISEQNRQQFHADLEKPMPIFLGELTREADKFTLDWSASYDIQGDDLFYDIKIASDPNFNHVISSSSVTGTKYVFNKLPAGTYYWQVIIRDAKGNNQIAFDKYTDKADNIHFGVKTFIVP